MTTTRPRVSVVIACYNYGHFLAQCVQSALDQPGVVVDVTVVDDASTDDSVQVAERLAQSHGVRLLRHTTNAGYIASFNEVLATADGEFVVKLDADDMLTKGSLARATALLQARPEVGFAYGRPFHFTRPDAVPPSRPVLRWQVWPGHTWLERRCSSSANCISNPEVVMRRSVLEQVGFLRPELPHTCDLELWLRLAAHADVGRVQGPFQGCYRVHDGSMQRTVNAGVLTDLRGRRDAFASFFARSTGDVEDAARLQDMALRRLCALALDRACRAYDRGRVDEAAEEALVAFAAECHPRYEELPEWTALQRRRRVGARATQFLPPFLLRAVHRRLLEEVGKVRWQLTGL